MTHADRRRGQAGFTLIEAMISMFFIAFIAGEMGMVMSYSSRSSNLARRITEANLFAEQVQESCRNAPYANLQIPLQFTLTSPGSGAPITATESGACATVPAAPAVCQQSTILQYTWERTVTPIPIPPSTVTPTYAMSALANIDVVVKWTDAQGAPQQVIVSTTRSKY